MRILAIHAHPDDIEITCGGTLLRLKELGHDLVYATMTAGDKGSAELNAEAIANVRREEARTAAEGFGAEFHCLEFKDLEIDVDADARRRVTECLRRASADLVITAPPVDYMTDHEHTSRLVRDACFCASVPNFKTRQWDPAPVTRGIPHLYYVDPIEGVDWFGQSVPYDFVVDVSETVERKLEMLACHASQRDWLRRQHGEDEYLDSARAWAAKRGADAGVAYGEAFRQHRGHPYPGEDVLSQLLSD